MSLSIAPHPLLDAGCFTTTFPRPLGEDPSPAWLLDLLRLDAAAPVARDETVRQQVRDLLRHGGYKPTGRGKPASEYLVRAVSQRSGRDELATSSGAGAAPSLFPSSRTTGERSEPHERGKLGPINAAVDACNVVSLHSALPISVVDLDRARAPLSILLAPEGASYVFNASGQTIDLAGLLVLADADGPCANAVKDAQRTKTHAGTTRTLSVVWGTKAAGDRTARTTAWYRELLERLGASTADA